MESSIVVNANAKETIKASTYRETCEISTAGNLLGVTASAKVVAIETATDEIRATIRTTFTVVKWDEDGYFSEQERAESVRTIPCQGVTPATACHLYACVNECGAAGGPTRAGATVTVGGWWIRENEINLLNAESEGLLCKTEKESIETVKALNDVSLTLSYTDEARMPIVRVLDSCGFVTVRSVYPSDGSYRVEGEVNVRVLALTDNGQLITQVFSHDFAQDNAEEGVTKDVAPEVEGTIKQLDFTVTESDKRLLVTDVIVKLSGTVQTETEVENVKDAYSVKNELETAIATYLVPTHFCLKNGREKVSATTPVGGVGEVLGVLTPGVTVTASRVGGGLVAEGSVVATCLYLDENGEKKSVRGEIPFSVDLGAFPCEGMFTPEATVTAIGARPRGGDELEWTAEVSVTVRGAHVEGKTFIESVTLGAEKEEAEYAVSLYIVKDGETLWDVAKALNTDEETLRAQNPEVALPVKAGDKVLVYHPL